MTDKQRRAAKNDVLHKLVKDRVGNMGPIDADDAAASATILKKFMAEEGIPTTSPKEIAEMQRALFSDTGADPTLAERQIKAKLEREKRRRRR